MNTLLSSARIHPFLHHRSSSFALLERLTCLSDRYISNSGACLTKSVKENEGFVSRLKKIFSKSSEKSFRRMMLCSSKSGTVDKNMGEFLYLNKKVPLDWHCGRQGLVSCRQMSLLSSLRAVFGVNPRNSKPTPIREPTIPQKPVKDKNKDKKQKKPVVRTEENSEEEVTHVRSAMMDEHGNSVTEENFVRTEWGVRIKDQARKVDPQTDAVETIEKPFYVVKLLWGVNVKQFITRDEVARVNTAISNSNRNVPSSKPKSSHVIDNFSRNSPSFQNREPKSKKEVPNAAKQLSSNTLSVYQITESDAKSGKTVNKVESYSGVQEKKPWSVRTPFDTSTTGPDRKMPEELNRDNFAPGDEINARKNVTKRNKNRQKNPKKRLQSSKSVKVSGTGDTYGLKKRSDRKKPSVNPSKVDETTNKKLHTSSTSNSFSNLNQLLFVDNNLKRTSVEMNDKKKSVDGSRDFVGEAQGQAKPSGDSGSLDVDTVEKSLKSGEHPWGGKNPHNSKEHTVKTVLNSKDGFDRVQTIHPDVNPPPKQILEASEAARNEASRLVQQPLTSVSTKLDINGASLPDTSLRHPIPIDLERDANTYELKNYAYLRPIDVKDTRPFLANNQKSKES